MDESKDDERDEEWFKEVYGKEYTGPVRSTNESSYDNPSLKKRLMASREASGEPDDEGDGHLDPNAVPTDFTSREAKVWEAKAKAIERNWKKKKEEELICRICGEYGHFSQGCPATLGVSRKPTEVVEKVAVKDRRLKPRIIGTSGSTIQGIEKDTGCRLKVEDNTAAGNGSFFVRISGSSRTVVGKAVDAVKKLIDNVQHERKPQGGSYRSHGSHKHGHNANALGSGQVHHISNQPPHHEPSIQPYLGQDFRYYEDAQHGSMEQMNQRHQMEAGTQNGSFAHWHKLGDDLGTEVDAGYDQKQSITMNIESLEHKFVEETMQLTKDLNDAEDKENTRHREAIREIQELYQQKMISLRSQQGKQREEFLRQEGQYRQQQYQHYQQPKMQLGPEYYDYDMGPASGGGFSSREQVRYGNSMDRNDGGSSGEYGSFRGERVGYHNSSQSYRNSSYDAPSMPQSKIQGYEAGQYRY